MIVSKIGNTIIIDGEGDTIYKNLSSNTAFVTINFPKAKWYYKYLPAFIRNWLLRSPHLIFKNLHFIGNGNFNCSTSSKYNLEHNNVDKNLNASKENER